MKLRALSSVYGRIEVIALAVGGEITASKFKRKYSNFIRAFSDRTKIVVLGKVKKNTDAQNEEIGINEVLDEALIDKDSYLVLIDANHPEQDEDLGKWIEDPFSVLESPTGMVTLLEPFYFKHKHNQLIAEQLSNGFDTLIKSTELEIEGGNILVGDDYVIIGKDLLYKNLSPEASSSKPDSPLFLKEKGKIEAKIRADYGVNFVIWAGSDEPLPNPLNLARNEDSNRQPLFHIDLYLTLGGRSSDLQKQGDEVIFVAKLILTKAMYKHYAPDLEFKKDSRFFYLEQLQAQLNEAAKFFDEYGKTEMGPRFHVVRIPMQVIFPQDENEKPIIRSFNNCLTEWYYGIRRAYLPSFGLHQENEDEPCLECQAAAKFEGRGFRVEFVEASFRKFAKENGSLNCMTKVLKRSKQ